MKVLATGDWQIGLHPNLGKRPGDRLRDQADVTLRIAELAAERDVDLVLLAGDLLEGPSATPEDLAVIADFIEACPCPALATTGNSRHDLAMRETNGLAIFDRLDGITVSSMPDVFLYPGCAVFTLPWVSPARWVAKKNGGDRDEIHAEMSQLLIDCAVRGKEDCERVAPGLPHVMLAHWHVDTATSANGSTTALFKEPLLPLSDLQTLGFDAVILGHNHRQQVLSDDPLIFHVGSPMCLDFGEESFEHGVWIVEFGPEVFEGFEWEFVPIESRRFLTIDWTPTEDADLESLPPVATDLMQDGAVVRLRFTAAPSVMRRINTGRIVDELLAAGAHVVKLDPHTVHESRARVSDVERPDEITEPEWLDRWLELTETPEDARADVRAVFASYQETVA